MFNKKNVLIIFAIFKLGVLIFYLVQLNYAQTAITADDTFDIPTNSHNNNISAARYTELSSNCLTFVSERGYITSPLTELEKNFSIAFSLLVYRDIEQIERLLRAIYRPQNIYCVHVDNKTSSEDIFEALLSISQCFDNVFLTDRRYDVKWGTMTVLEPELLCMKELWNRSGKWIYFINLTGQEFPLKTNYELVKILTAYDGANDIEGTIQRANKERWIHAGQPPHNIVPTKGSVHIVASRGYVDFVLHSEVAKDFLNWTRRVDIPDETFFSSLNHNPHLGVPGSYKSIPETDNVTKPFLARFKNWGAWPCHGKRVRMICVFGVGDLPLLTTRRELFANKFHFDFHRRAYDWLEEWHKNKTINNIVDDDLINWYSQLGFVKNKI